MNALDAGRSRGGGWSVWLLAIRPKTLPAAVSPILVGSAVAVHERGFHLPAALAAMAVALLLQIAANLANDVFDFHRGADVARLGPTRVTQGGLIPPHRVKQATLLTLGLATLAGLYLVWRGGWPILVLGVLALLSAVAYTAGPFPLGYHGLGDLFVFLFFGLVGVTGSAYVQTREVTALALLAAIPIGCIATAIIIVNNLRDIDTDRAAAKRTLAVRIGRVWTIRQYQALLLAAYLTPLLLGAFGAISRWGALPPLLSLPSAARLLTGVRRESGRALNPILGGTARLTLVFGVLFAAGLVL